MRRPVLMLAIAAVVGAVVAVPVAVYATHSFSDVPSSNTFHADIAWLAESGVTRGCNPPANTEFCPDDFVTREQMAAFMRRLAQYLGAEDGTPALADHAITAGLADTVEDDAITNAKISSGAVGYEKLGDDVVVARAHGLVFHNGSVARSQNLSSSNVTNPETGVYCISGLPFAPTNVLVSNSLVANAGAKDVRMYAMGTFFGDECGPNNQIRIHVYNPDTLTLSPGNFSIIIF